MGDLLGQIGHRLHGADEVAGGQLPDVPCRHPEGGRERRSPGPGGHGGRQPGRRLPGAGHEVQFLNGADALRQDVEGAGAPGQLGAALVAESVLQRAAMLLPPGALVARDATGPPWLEDDGREHGGQHRGLGAGQDVGAERLRDQKIGLVVDA